MTMKRRNIILAMTATVLAAAACRQNDYWSDEEISLIRSESTTMRVLTVDVAEDSLILRKECSEFSDKELMSEEYKILADKMVATVTAPWEDGVGIAGPQVGISRRIVSVQRFDKAGEPFETYPNIKIICHRGEKKIGPEGCLSIPGRRGDVARYQDIDIKYTSPVTLHDTTEHITGFTAVIFQHECDHLDGILYTDYLE